MDLPRDHKKVQQKAQLPGLLAGPRVPLMALLKDQHWGLLVLAAVLQGLMDRVGVLMDLAVGLMDLEAVLMALGDLSGLHQPEYLRDAFSVVASSHNHWWP